MANSEQLAILRKGVKFWNEWRKRSPNVDVDLMGADLFEVNLRGADLSGADLVQAYLYLSNAYQVNLRGANLVAAELRLASSCPRNHIS